MIPDNLVIKLKERYSDIDPLVFHRSVERAKTPGHLFDILESIPEYPIIWSDIDNCWITCNDLYLSEEFFEEVKL